MYKKILILGGLGFVGFHLALHLANNKNNKILLVDDNSRGKIDKQTNKLLKRKNVKFKKLDLTEKMSFKNLDKNFDNVYLLASIVGVNNTLINPVKIIEINTLIIINTLIWLKKTKIKKFIFSSTSESYAGSVDTFNFKVPTPENVPLTISNIEHSRYTYAATKILGESAFLNLGKVKDFNCIIIRFHNIYGTRMGFKHVIPHLIERFYKNENPFKIYGPKQTRSFCYIDDAVKIMSKIMNKKKNKYSIYNIGNNNEISIEKLTKKVGKYLNFKGKFIYKPPFPGSTNRRCPNIMRIQNEFNYKMHFSLDKGLKKTIKWYLRFFKNKKTIYEKSFQKPNEFKNVKKII